MKDTKIYYKKTKLNDPIMFVGLPGIGSIGSLVAEHLKKELKAKKFATLYSPHFPYQIIMLKKGTFRLVNNRFYYAKGAKGKSDIIILLGDAQPMTPEGQYDVNEHIVEFFKLLGGRRIYTIGGYSMGAQYVNAESVRPCHGCAGHKLPEETRSHAYRHDRNVCSGLSRHDSRFLEKTQAERRVHNGRDRDA